MIAAGTKIFSRRLKTNDALNQNVREELPPRFAFEHQPYHAPGIILEDVNDPHEEFIRVKYWMPYQKLLLIPRTGATAPTCERNALVHRSNMMFLEPEGEFSENAWNQKVSWANLCWHIRGERLQNPTTSAVEQQAAAKKAKVEVEPEQVVPKAECALGTTCSSSTSSTFASAMLKAEVESSEEQVQEHQEDYPHLDECASAFPMTKVFIEWQESICFEAELEAEHAAEQQAAAKKAKVEVKPEHVVPKRRVYRSNLDKTYF